MSVPQISALPATPPFTDAGHELTYADLTGNITNSAHTDELAVTNSVNDNSSFAVRSFGNTAIIVVLAFFAIRLLFKSLKHNHII